MEVDEPAGTSMDTSEPLEPGIEWRFSQVKGNIEGDDTHTEGLPFGFNLTHVTKIFEIGCVQSILS